MQVDARSLDDGAVIETDLLIIGAGAAGIAIATALDQTPIAVCVLESGGLALDAETQELYSGTLDGTFRALGDGYLSTTRLRYFGGTTNHWAGWCRPLDPIDFEERPWIPDSGWPFGRSELDPYYRRAANLVQIARFDDRRVDRTNPLRPPLLADSSDIDTVRFHFSPPTRFGQLYRDPLLRSRNVTVVLHANAVHLRANEAGSAVDHVEAACLDGPRFTVRARRVVLAAGGIENARLLLTSDSVHPRGLGNRHDLVGRFFADHPHMAVGRVVVSDPWRRMGLYDFHGTLDGPHTFLGVLTPTESSLRTNELLNYRVHVAAPPPADEVSELDLAVGRAAGAVRAVMERQPHPERRRVLRYWQASEPRSHSLRLSCETSPLASSRVTLSTARDPLGIPRPHLNWEASSDDFERVRRGLLLLGRELGTRLGGRVRIDLDTEAPWAGARGGAHHMGTTRMHGDPRRGVVDSDCRVHGLANLYVAGSSIFPTYGYANPTLTIVALALRLAERLRFARAT